MSSSRRPLLWLMAALAPLVAYTVPAALETVFTRFSLWDDEGYVMMSVASFLDGHPLYDQVFSQYGPFYFLFKWAVFSIADLPVSHDATRFTTVAIWLTAATACAALVMRQTCSLALSVATYGLSFIVLSRLTAEPGHPQELAVLLVVLAMLAATVHRPLFRGALLGALVVATLLVKINIGLLLGLAVTAAAFSGRLPDARPALPLRLAHRLLALAVLFAPALLTRRHFGTTWGSAVALVTTIAAACTLAALRRSSLHLPGRREISAFLAAFALLGLASIGFVMARGTTTSALLDAILLAPLAFSGKFFVADVIPLSAPVFAAGSAVLAWLCLRQRPGHRGFLTVRRLAALRGLLGLLVLVCVLTESGAATLFFFAGPFIWLAVARPADGSPEAGAPEPDFPRRVLVFGAALQLLVIYPVASSQATWATFLLIPLGMSCLWDARTALRPAPVTRPARFAGLLAVYLGYLAWSPTTTVHTPAEQPLFAVRGAGRMRLPAVQAGTAHWVIQNLRAHGRTFFSMPGQNSFYFWADMEPPTLANHNYWMLLFGEERQARLVERLRATSGLIVLVCPLMVGSWQIFGHEGGGAPLVRELQQAWTRRLHRGAFELHARLDDDTEWHEFFLLGPMVFDGETTVPLPLGILPDAHAGTLTGWFRSSTPGIAIGAQHVAPLADGSRDHVGLLTITERGRLAAHLDPGAPPLVTPDVVADGRWHHWALAFSVEELQLYLDGRLVERRWRDRPASPPTRMQLGNGVGPTGWKPFTGDLADIELWPRRAPPEEIKALHRAGPRF